MHHSEVVLSVVNIYYNNMKLMVECPLFNIYLQTSKVFRHQVPSDLGSRDDSCLCSVEGMVRM